MPWPTATSALVLASCLAAASCGGQAATDEGPPHAAEARPTPSRGPTAGAHFSLPPGTIVSAGLVSGKKLTIKLQTTLGITQDVECLAFSFSGPIPASGLTITLSAPPTFTACTSQGQTAYIEASGTWKLAEIDAAAEDAGEPNAGDELQLEAPLDGMRISIGGCSVYLGHYKPALLHGSFDDVSAFELVHAPGKPYYVGCPVPVSHVYVTADLAMTPSFHDEP